MNHKEIFEALCKLLISNEFVGNMIISEDMRLGDDLGIDSLTYIAILCTIEQNFNIIVKESEMNITEKLSIRDLVNLIEDSLN